MRDLTNQKTYENDGYTLPEGNYTATIETAELTRSKSGFPMVKMVLEVEGKKVFEYMMLDSDNEKSKNIGLSKIKSLLLALGVTNLRFPNDNVMVQSLYGQVGVYLTLKDDMFNGTTKKKNQVGRYYSMKGHGMDTTKRQDQYDSTSIPF